MNWRKPLIYSLLKMTGSDIPEYLQQIKQYQYLPKQQLKDLTNGKLEELLLHAYTNVPYYNEILKQSGVVDNGKVKLENFKNIPPLTKDIIRNQAQQLYSADYKSRKPYPNTSGGSTGEPVGFMQDKKYSDWNIANTIYFKSFVNQDIGQKEIRLWGSERDLLVGKEKLLIRLKNWIYNRKDLNAFKMSKDNMTGFAKKINNAKPTWIEAYTQVVFEFARFLKENNISINTPKGVLTSAGTLYPHMQELIEEVFQCKTFNRYGSREVGGIACNCENQKGLHLSIWNNYIEILDDNMNPVGPGQTGKIYVTNLNNFSMPIIRYDIGDMATSTQNPTCSCGRTTPIVKQILGRHMEVFKTKDGKIIPAEFFIHFIGVVYNKGFIEKFQVIQEDYDNIAIKAIVKDKQGFEDAKPELTNSIKKVMGENCRINFESVDELEATQSGKYLYTVSRIK